MAKKNHFISFNQKKKICHNPTNFSAHEAENVIIQPKKLQQDEREKVKMKTP